MSLISYVITTRGEAYALQWLRGVKRNLAYKAAGYDIDMLKAIANGPCIITLANSNYFAQMMSEQAPYDQQSAAVKITPIIPQNAHVNVSGAILIEHSKHPTKALDLLEFLSGKLAQEIYSTVNFEFPARGDIRPSKSMRTLYPEFDGDLVATNKITSHYQRAVELVKLIEAK